MNVVVFEDQAVDRLGEIVAARPACDLMIGSRTLCDALGHLGHVRRAPRPHLARHLAALGTARIPLWGGLVDSPAVTPAASRHGAVTLLVNARTVPSRRNIIALRGLIEAGRRGAIRGAGGTLAALVHLAPDGGGPDRAACDELLARGPAATDAIDDLALPAVDAPLDVVALPHDLVSAHERLLEESLAARIDAGGYREMKPGLFVAPTATVAEFVVVRQGPVVVEAGAEIGPFVCLDGPVWIGPEARVNPHAWLRGGTAVGRACRVGGEVEASVLEPFSNKPHDGFLGHSHVGSWVNLAAGTITSNLKASYGPVRFHDAGPDGGRTSIDTGRQFLGALVADFVKTAINTSIPCGCRIGAAATIGGDVPERVAAFHNMLVGGAAGSRSTVDQTATALGRMMARRGLDMRDADRELLAALAEDARFAPKA